jgi:polyhydroxyalkanoate synthesis regulator phasin
MTIRLIGLPGPRVFRGVAKMTETFEKLKTALQAKGTLTDEEIANAINESGDMTPEETMWLSAELHERQRAAQTTVTMEQFLQANHVLDTADPTSQEYKAAQKIVDAFLAGN